MPVTEEDRRLFGIQRLNRPRSDIPAVTHLDYSAHIQTSSDTSLARASVDQRLRPVVPSSIFPWTGWPSSRDFPPRWQNWMGGGLVLSRAFLASR